MPPSYPREEGSDDSGENSGESVAVPELTVEADRGEGAFDPLARDVVQLTAGDLGKKKLLVLKSLYYPRSHPIIILQLRTTPRATFINQPEQST